MAKPVCLTGLSNVVAYAGSMLTEEIGLCLFVWTTQRPFQLGLRFSAKAFGPSTVSSLRAMATKAG